jgi:hypothetical protein
MYCPIAVGGLEMAEREVLVGSAASVAELVEHGGYGADSGSGDVLGNGGYHA